MWQLKKLKAFLTLTLIKFLVIVFLHSVAFLVSPLTLYLLPISLVSLFFGPIWFTLFSFRRDDSVLFRVTLILLTAAAEVCFGFLAGAFPYLEEVMTDPRIQAMYLSIVAIITMVIFMFLVKEEKYWLWTIIEPVKEPFVPLHEKEKSFLMVEPKALIPKGVKTFNPWFFLILLMTLLFFCLIYTRLSGVEAPDYYWLHDLCRTVTIGGLLVLCAKFVKEKRKPMLDLLTWVVSATIFAGFLLANREIPRYSLFESEVQKYSTVSGRTIYLLHSDFNRFRSTIVMEKMGILPYIQKVFIADSGRLIESRAELELLNESDPMVGDVKTIHIFR